MEIKDSSLRRRLRRIRVLAVDVDGVLTDGGMYYGPEGDSLKRFNSKDGMGLRLLQEAGIRVVIITGEDTQIVHRRAEKLRINDVFTGVEEKEAQLKEFLSSNGFTLEETGYVGDDVNDLGPMKVVSVAFAPADAVAEIQRVAHFVTSRRGGDGAVREVADLLLYFLQQ